jgi:hypothetical protein
MWGASFRARGFGRPAVDKVPGSNFPASIGRGDPRPGGRCAAGLVLAIASSLVAADATFAGPISLPVVQPHLMLPLRAMARPSMSVPRVTIKHEAQPSQATAGAVTSPSTTTTLHPEIVTSTQTGSRLGSTSPLPSEGGPNAVAKVGAGSGTGVSAGAAHQYCVVIGNRTRCR